MLKVKFKVMIKINKNINLLLRIQTKKIKKQLNLS